MSGSPASGTENPSPESEGDPSLHAQLLTQIARAQGLQHRFEEAHATLNHAQSLLRANEAQPHLARAHELLSADPWLVEHEPQRLQRLAELGGAQTR